MNHPINFIPILREESSELNKKVRATCFHKKCKCKKNKISYAVLEATNICEPMNQKMRVNGNVLFDHVTKSNDIHYNMETGRILVNDPGLYYVNYWINLINDNDVSQILSVSLATDCKGKNMFPIKSTSNGTVPAGCRAMVVGSGIVELSKGTQLSLKNTNPLNGKLTVNQTTLVYGGTLTFFKIQ